MKVREVIAMLNVQHDLDDDIMAVWWGSSFRELPQGTWSRAVQVFDDYGVPESWDKFIDDIVADVQEAFGESRD